MKKQLKKPLPPLLTFCMLLGFFPVFPSAEAVNAPFAFNDNDKIKVPALGDNRSINLSANYTISGSEDGKNTLTPVTAILTEESGDPTISPTMVTFDKETSRQADIEVTADLNDKSITGIINASSLLDLDTDYVHIGTKIILQQSYLATLPL